MPPYRTEPPRRSRRLSQLTPKSYDGDGFETYDPEFVDRYSSESTSSFYSPHIPPPPSECPPAPSSCDGQQSPLPPSHSRRASKVSEHIPRPANSFMLFRSNYWARQKHNPTERDHREISRMAAVAWKKLPETEKDYWRKLAAIRKADHAQQFPEYKYTPTSRRNPRTQKKKASRSNQREVARCQQLAEHLMLGWSFEGLETFTSPERNPSRSGSLPSSSVKQESSPRITFDSLPCKERNSFPSTSYFHVTDEQSFRGSPLLFGSIKAENNIQLQDPGLIEVGDESVCSDAFVPTQDIPPLDLPAPAVLPATNTALVKSEPQYGSLRLGSPTLPADREIDYQFGYRPQIYNLEPQQTVLTTPSGYSEVSSFANYDYYEQSNYEYFNVAVAGATSGNGDPFNEGFLSDLAQFNSSYLFDEV